MFDMMKNALTAVKAAADAIELERVSGTDAAALVLILTEGMKLQLRS